MRTENRRARAIEGYGLAIREGLLNFRRGRTLSMAMIGSIAAAVFAIGAFGLIALNVNSLLKRWESRVELVAFLSSDVTEAKAQPVLGRIRAIPEVSEARIITGRESWEELFPDLGESVDIRDMAIEEILPTSIVVRLSPGNRQIDAIRTVASQIASVDGVDEVKFEEMLIERYVRFRRELTAFAVGTSLFWLLVFGIIIFNIAGLASVARKNEIRALREMGASRRFILRLLTVEGLAQGLVGAGVGIGILLGMVALLSTRMGMVQLPGRLFAATAGLGLLLGLVANGFFLRRLIFIIVAFILVIVPVRTWAGPEAAADEIVQYQQELSQIKEELRQSRAGAAEIEREEQVAVKELNEIDNTVDMLEQQVKAGENQIVANRAEAEEIQIDLGSYEKQYEQSREELGQWLRLLCNRREPTMIEVILNDIPQSRITTRREVISRLVTKEAESFERVQQLRSAVLERREALARRAEWDALYYETVKQQAEQSREKKTRREAMLSQLREEKNIFKAAINDMDASAQELHELLGAQRHDAPSILAGGIPFREMKGLLLWPADGEVTARFGRVRDPETKTYTRHLGVDISAPIGSPIRAIHNAVVAYSDWFGGYGRLIILDHGGGYSSVYAHCSEILVTNGDAVMGGQPIALTGETGSLKGPYLYFEIREQGQPVDPALWLQRRNTDAAQSE